MKKNLATLALITLGITSSAYSSLILEYDFNDNVTGSTSASTGSDTTSVTMLNTAGVGTNLHGSSGSGVSGAAGDYVFDNSASTGMSSGTDTGGRGNAGDRASLDSLTSFTLQGWLYTDQTGAVWAPRLLEKNGGDNNSKNDKCFLHTFLQRSCI